jgi:hypothetical protein
MGETMAMSTSKLTSLERQVLGVLILGPDARIADRTVDAIATRSGLSEGEVRRTLAQLESLDPTAVHRDVDAKLGVEFWIALPPAIEALEASPED